MNEEPNIEPNIEDSYMSVALRAKAQLAEANARADRLRAALGAVEWEGAWMYCPWCHGLEKEGHKLDCARQLALTPEV